MDLLCGITQQFGSGAPSYKLHTNSPTWYAQDIPAGFTRDQFEDLLDKQFRKWAAVCKLNPQKHTNPKTTPTETVIVADLGGRNAGGGIVLADQEMGKEFLRMRINSRVQFIYTDAPRTNGTDLGRTVCHELGHFLGALHFPDGEPAELMEARISHITEPQPTEAAFMARLYGAPNEPTPGEARSRPKAYTKFTDTNGVTWEAEGEMRRVV